MSPSTLNISVAESSAPPIEKAARHRRLKPQGPTAMTSDMNQHRVLITVSVMIASIMQALDATIANVALPHIQGSLSATQDQITWVLTSYIIATAIMMPLSGWLAQQFGRKRIFLISIVVFTIASVLCGLAQTLPQMVLFRGL